MITFDYPTFAFFCGLFFLIGGAVGVMACFGVFVWREVRSFNQWEGSDHV